MKIEDFICPCCGLPNHLEFKSRDDYDKVREQEATGIVGNINTIFDKYLIGSEDGRTPTNETKLELKARLERIQQFSNRFNDLTFQEWFDNNVVCFINDKDDYIWLGSHAHTLDISKNIETQKILTGIEKLIETQDILTSIELQIINSNSFSYKEEHITYQWTLRQPNESNPEEAQYIEEINIGTELEPIMQKQYKPILKVIINSEIIIER